MILLTLLFIGLLLGFIGSAIGFAVKFTWSIVKIVICIVFFPLVLIALCLCGLIYLAIPLLIIAGVVAIAKAVA